MISLLKTYRIPLAGAGLALLVSYLVLFVLWPGGGSVYADYSTLQQVREKVQSAADWQSQIAMYEEKEAELEELVAALFVSLPREDQMSSIVDLIVRKAEDSGVDIQSMRPLEREQLENYLVIPVSVGADGSYHAIGIFINRLEQSSQLVQVRNIQMESAVSGGGLLRADLQLNVITRLQNSKKAGDNETID